MKIAILGSAPSSLPHAPFKNSTFLEWVEGKQEQIARAHGEIAGDFDIWGCSPACWAQSPRATRWFEVHRWEPGKEWFSHEYCQFLRDFKGIVYTGAAVPEIANHVVYPIDRMEEKFSSYFMNSSVSLMLALAIDTIEKIREARQHFGSQYLPEGVKPEELDVPDSEDIIGLWGIDMAATEEYGFQRPGCQFFVLEAMRRGIGVFIPPESDLMRPMPIYGLSEWDHNYIKLTTRAREVNGKAQRAMATASASDTELKEARAEMAALNSFVNTWTSPYGMMAGMVIRQVPGTGLGSGITHFDGRPIGRMNVAPVPPTEVLHAMTEDPAAALGKELIERLKAQGMRFPVPQTDPTQVLERVITEATFGRGLGGLLQVFAKAGESSEDTLRRILEAAHRA